MTDMTLAEQLGIQALVDELRHRALVVREHLDLPQRRAEVVAKLRAFYAARDVDVDDSTIEAGVKAYFDGRLTAEMPRLSPLKSWLAHRYITRDQWWRRVVFILIAMVSVSIALWYGVRWLDEYHRDRNTASLADADATVHAQNAALREESVRRRDQLVSLQDRLRTAPIVALRPLIEPVPSLLDAARQALALPGHRKIDRQQVETLRPVVDSERTAVARAGQLIKDAGHALDDAKALVAAHERYSTIVSGSTFKLGKELLSDLTRTEQGAADALEQADIRGVSVATAAVDKLAQRLDESTRLRVALDELASIEHQFGGLAMGGKDREIVHALLQQAHNTAKNGDVVQVEAHIESLRRLVAFAQIPLRIQIPVGGSVKSGVTRRSQSGGKAWFLVAEAVDASGTAVSVPMTSSETGATQWVERFAVRVEEDEYLRRKAEKKATGHIADRVLGVKPMGAISISYKPDIGTAPDVITSW